jgi:hypothetical protein
VEAVKANVSLFLDAGDMARAEVGRILI